MQPIQSVTRKFWLLTYAQCNLPLDEVLDKVKKSQELRGKPVKFIAVSDEEHNETEGRHRHVFFLLDVRMKLRPTQMRCLDIVGSDGKNYHPNVEFIKYLTKAYQYCIKDGNFIEWGSRPSGIIKMSAKDKNSMLIRMDLVDLIDNGEVSLLQAKLLNQCKEIYRLEKQRKQAFEKPIVHYYFGKTGTGKTRGAIEEAIFKYGDGNYWVCQKTDQWFDGYRGQDAVILDDIRSNTWNFSNMLRLLDRYYLEVPIKGGHTRWIPREIWITAPGEPRDIYKNHATGESFDDIDQLERRIDDCKCFEVYGEEPTYCQLHGMTSHWFDFGK